MHSLVIDDDRAAALRLCATLEAKGAAVRAATVPNGAGDGDIAGFASALVALEETMAADPPAAVVLAGAGDAALAGAIVAAKLLVPIGWVAGKATGPPANATLIGLVAERLADDPVALAAWLRAASAQPAPGGR